MNVVRYRVTGTHPLLMHSPKGMGGAAAGLGQKRIPSPADEAEAATYRLPDGQLYLPAIAFRSAILNASKGRRIGRFAAKGVLSSSLFVTDEHVPLTDAKGEPLSGFEIDVRRCVVQRQGVMRARPKIDEWCGELALEFDPDFLKVDWITEIFALAGRTVGVGDYRPERSGPFGRFTVEER